MRRRALQRLPWRAAALAGWLRYRGWRNRYWREDTIRWRCDHEGNFWGDEHMTVCMDCGASIGRFAVTSTTGATSTTVYTVYSVRRWHA